MNKENPYPFDINDILSYIESALEGNSKEYDKIDFKKEWPNLKDALKISEFLKDVTSIINTPGTDGYLIYGIDEKTKTVVPSDFKSQTGLLDENELIGLIEKRIDPVLNLNLIEENYKGKKIGVLHIPQSLRKPHLIKGYLKSNGSTEEHRIFIKYGSTTRIAGKYDLDKMSNDNQKLRPDYLLQITSSEKGFEFTKTHTNLALKSSLIIENLGTRPIAIKRIEYVLVNTSVSNPTLVFTSHYNKDHPKQELIEISNLIVKSNELELFGNLLFTSTHNDEVSALHWNQVKILSISSKIYLNNGKILNEEIELV